jgi:hypothetical protein
LGPIESSMSIEIRKDLEDWKLLYAALERSRAVTGFPTTGSGKAKEARPMRQKKTDPREIHYQDPGTVFTICGNRDGHAHRSPTTGLKSAAGIACSSGRYMKEQ